MRPFDRSATTPGSLQNGIQINPWALSSDNLRERAWQVMEPVYLERLAGLVERFGAAHAAQRGDDQVSQVAEAAVAGRIATLLLEAERQMPGRFDATTGRVDGAELARPDIDDVLDDLGEQVLRTGGEVIVVPAERMPTTSGLAAIYRF